MRVFAETGHCASGVHCETCRDLAGGRAWRLRLSRTFLLPGGDPDFACPRGRPWGYEGPSRGLGDTVARVIKWATGGRVRPCGGCGKRRARLNRVWPYTVNRAP